MSSDSSLNPNASDQPEPMFKRWLLFLFRPADVLELLHIVSNPKSQFSAASLPPDVSIASTFWDEERGFMGLILESEYFEDVQVFERDGQLLGDYPRAILSFAQEAEKGREELWGDANEEGVLDELQRLAGMSLFEGLQAASARDFHVRGLNFSAADLLLILRAKSVVDLPVFPIYPRDVRVLGVIVHEPIKTWSVFLEHADFPAAKLTEVQEEEMMVYVEFESDGHDIDLRIAIPGARLGKKISLDADELENQ